jgi:hypothetical protein
MQEQHDFPYLLCLLPRIGNPLSALRADAIDGLQFGGPFLDYHQNLGSKSGDQLLARIGPMPFTKPLPRYFLTPSAVAGGTVFIMVALNCIPCSRSLTQYPSAASHSPAFTEGSDPTTVVSSRCPFCLDAEHTKPAFVVVERNALYDAGDLLGRGSALRHRCGHKWGFILPRMEGTWAIQYRRDFRRLLGSVEPRRVESWSVWL